MKANKYEKGDKVIVEGENTEVVNVMYVGGEWFYQVAAKEVDLGKKEIVEGVKTVREAEMKPAKEDK